MFLTDARNECLPDRSADWVSWVEATATRNFALGDPLVDWLELYGASQGFKRDNDLPGFDPRTDFTNFLLEQARRFEVAVVQHLRSLAEIVTIASSAEDVRKYTTAESTFEAMKAGVPVIHQGVLRDAEHRTYGAPDLLVRSDVLLTLFPTSMSEVEASISAPDLGGSPWHYRVVDLKFTTLHLLADGTLANQGSSPAYKTQLHIYNRALGRLQGFLPRVSYLLGRGWEKTLKGETARGFSCMDLLAPVFQDGTLSGSKLISELCSEAPTWIRELRRDGGSWSVTPRPTRPELYPDFSNQQDGPWHRSKQRIAEELEDLTILWQVGVRGRKLAHESGIYSWRDPHCTPAIVGVTGDKRAAVLQALLDINGASDGPPVSPARVRAAEDAWRPSPDLEFYVDFETVNDLADDFSQIPRRGGQPLIFMIGCGHIENGAWCFRCFTVDALDETSEATIIEEWLSHMESVRQRVASKADSPKLIHWSPAETSMFETAYNSAKERHPEKSWPSPQWFDFLGKVVREQPVVTRGAMGFGLKAVAKAMHSHGLVETLWSDGPADGLGAMIGAWWCHDQVASTGAPIHTLPLMKDIMQYNEVDCRVVMEAIRYLRANH